MSEENMIPGRISNFKNKGRADEMRRRRSTATIELRKANRDDQMLKRRNINPVEPLSPINENNAHTEIMQLSDIIRVLKEGDESKRFDAVQSARKTLSREKNPPINDLINAGIVPNLVYFVSSEFKSEPLLQFEACWALTNIASGNSEQTSIVVKEGAVPKLVELLYTENAVLVEQAAWALGNIAGDGAAARDLVLAEGGLDALLRAVSPDSSLTALRTLVWTVSNLCRNKNPPPSFESIRKCLPLLAQLVHHEDGEIIGDACWALSYLSDGQDWQIQEVVDSGVVPRLVSLLGHHLIPVLTPALRSVGNIVTGNSTQTDAVIKEGALPLLKNLLHHSRPNLVKEAAWSVSNITAGTSPQIQAVIDAQIIPSIIAVLQSGDYKAQKEAAHAVTNFTSNSTTAQLVTLLQAGVLQPFCNLLGSKDAKVVLVVLDGIQNLLFKAEAVGEADKVTELIEECGGLDKLEALQQHEQVKIYEKAYAIIELYFGQNEDVSDMAPNAREDQYEFNPQDPTGGYNF